VYETRPTHFAQCTTDLLVFPRKITLGFWRALSFPEDAPMNEAKFARLSFAGLFVCLVLATIQPALGQTVTEVHSTGLPTGSCSINTLYQNDNNGTLYTCLSGTWTSALNASSMNNTIWMDGVKYPWTAAGLRQAIADANGHGGLAGVVRIGSTANGILTNDLQQIELDGNTITVPSYTYIVGDGRDATGVDFIAPAGCSIPTTANPCAAFYFPPGTRESGIINLGIELDGGANGTCFYFEGNSTYATYNNIIQNVSCGNGFSTGTRYGMVLNPTPNGPNGANFIHDNIFQNIWFSGYNGNSIENPILSYGDYSNKFLNIQSDNPMNGGITFNGSFINDRLEFTVHKENSSNITALSLVSGTNGDIVDLYCDLSSAPGNACISDVGGGNHIVVSNMNATPLGTPNPNSLVENLTIDLTTTPFTRKVSVLLPMDTRLQTATFSTLGTPVNGAMILCSDCRTTDPCSEGGTGALAKGISDTWSCH
jgi:hypothetical protein